MIIEAVVIEYLKNKLTNIPVYAEIPKNRPGKFVIVEKIEGGMTNHINASTLSIYSYANSMYEAAQLNESVKEYMLSIAELNTISGSKLGGDSRDIDSSNKEYRYECIFNLYHY